MCQDEETLHPSHGICAAGDHATATTTTTVAWGATHAARRELEVGVAVEEHVLSLLLRGPYRSTRRRALAALVGGHGGRVPSGVHAPLGDGSEVGPVRLGSGAPSASAALLTLVVVHVLPIGLQWRRLHLLLLLLLLLGSLGEAGIDIFVVVAVCRCRNR